MKPHKPDYGNCHQEIENPSKILPNNQNPYQKTKNTAHISLTHFIKQLYSCSKPFLMEWKFYDNQLNPIHHRPWNTRVSVRVGSKIKPNQNIATETCRWRIGKTQSRKNKKKGKILFWSLNLIKSLVFILKL